MCTADTGWYYVPTATTTPRICETASMELSGTRKKGRGGNVDSRPMGCYDTEYYSHWNHIATNIECSDRYKCMCTSLQVCSNILGSSQNNLECFCGSSICTANQYCQESSSTCGSTAACSNQDGRTTTFPVAMAILAVVEPQPVQVPSLIATHRAAFVPQQTAKSMPF